jgi:hypothetical protein
MRRSPSRAHRPWAWCASLFLCLGLIAVAVGRADADGGGGKTKQKPAKRRVEVARCVSFSQSDGDRSAELSLSNGCDIAVSCGVSWSLRCESADGKRGPRNKGGAAFVLQPAESHGVSASADACGNDGWVIDDIAWHCSPESK